MVVAPTTTVLGEQPSSTTARDSATVAGWTLTSRVTGLLRVVTIGAVLGPTYFANMFQAGYVVPNLVFSAVAGPVLTMVLVPAIVQHVAASGLGRAKQMLGKVAGDLLVTAGSFAAALLLTSPLVAWTLTFGVPDAEQNRAHGLATLLVVLVAPQVMLYMIAGIGVAAQNARGRFALAAAAPAVENLVLIGAVLFAGWHYGTGLHTGEVPVALVIFLGIASTVAAGLHAVLQIFGAARAGLPVRPSLRERREPEVTVIRHRLLRSVSVAACPAVAMYALLVMAGTVPGGVFVVQISFAVFYAASYLGARAVSIAALPSMAGIARPGNDAGFATSYRQGLRYGLTAGLPLLVLLSIFAYPAADLLANGELRQESLIGYLAACLVVVAVAQLVGGLHDIGRHALFARLDDRGPRRASHAALAATLMVAGSALALTSGGTRLVGLAIAILAGEVVGAASVARRLRRELAPEPLLRARELLPAGAAALAMAPVAGVGSWVIDVVSGGRATDVALLVLFGLAALAGYTFVCRSVTVQRSAAAAVSAEPTRRTAERGTEIAHDAQTVGIAVVAAVLGGALAAVAGVLPTLVLCMTAVIVALVVVTARWPIVAVYLYLAALPFAAGIDRGTLLPLVRANEGLLAVLVTGAALGAYLRWCRGDRISIRLHRLDIAIGGFLLLSTVWPLASMMLRGNTAEPGDLVAVLPMCKLVGLYILVRLTVSTEPQMLRCVRLMVWTGAAIAVIAVLQTLEFGPVVTALDTLWSSEVDSRALTSRGTTTLASPLATGDYIIISLVLLACLATRGLLGSRERIGLGVVLIAGMFAAGQFTTWIAAVVAGVLLFRRFPDLRSTAVRYLPILPVAVLIGAPALLGRLQSFDGQGVPVSWLSRWDNLSNFYLPEFQPHNWILGVTPDSVLVAPETWRDVIYLESGYLWFLWVGGLPLLMGFGWLSTAVLQRSSALVAQPGALGAVAVAVSICWWLLLVLTVLDPHLALRGTGELLFSLLAIITGRLCVDRDP